MSLAEISARIAEIQSIAPTQDARLRLLSPLAGTDFASTLDAATSRLNGTLSSHGTPSTNSTDTQLIATAGTDGTRMAALAARYVGVAYVAGGRSPAGWDCAGFTHWVANQQGVEIPDVSWEQIKVGRRVAGMADALPGDLMFFHMPGGHHRDPSALGVNHVAIYLGGGKMVEAANPRQGTRISTVDPAHLVGIRRITAGVAPSYPSDTTALSGMSRPLAHGVATVDSGGSLSATQLRSVLEKAGFSGEGLRSAWAIAMRESRGRPGAVGAVNRNGTRDHGLFQLNDIHLGRTVDPSTVYDPLANARAAFKLSNGGISWSAWGIGRSGWAGHLKTAQPAFYAKINASYNFWRDRFPGEGS
jgi:cell wall-associated NlpC family hydrolase